jgi:glycerol-3-phosphate dehydrogenase
MAVTLDDVLSRRTRSRLFDRPATEKAADDVARLIAVDMGWDDAEVERQVAEFRNSCTSERAAGQLSEADLLGAHR